MKLDITITQMQFNEYLYDYSQNQENRIHLDDWTAFDEYYYELLKKYIKEKVTNTNEKIRIYFLPHYDNKYYAFRLKYESEKEAERELGKEEWFRNLMWLEDNQFSFWIWDEDYYPFFAKGLNNATNLEAFKIWFNNANKYEKNKNSKDNNEDSEAIDYLIKHSFYKSIQSLQDTIAKALNDKLNKVDILVFKNKYVDYQDTKNYNFEIVSNKSFQKLAKEKYNEFLAKFQDLKINKIFAKDLQLFYSSNDCETIKILEFYIYLYKALYCTLSSFISLAYSKEDALNKCINIKDYCHEYWNEQFVPCFIFNNPKFELFSDIYTSITKVLPYLNKTKEISDSKTSDLVNSFKVESYYVLGLTIALLSYLKFLTICQVNKVIKKEKEI
ncbi:hypothetical protein [Mycoplasmopsis fermentans]|uniref:hypothetical protein n=1 Tax=Mycoplasmopsis fermentans TaxID=2115 RepID=UPI000F02C4F6|nr:hypothetical protein [Mycoplasmopsis fermentans]RMX35408.1 PNAS-9 domain protein [Mycoplasmopsis fermentans MF-I1]